MIPDDKVVVTISHAGYIKRTPLVEYKIQNRGGVGQKGSTTRNEDFLEHMFVGTNHQYMLFLLKKEMLLDRILKWKDQKHLKEEPSKI